ncbi:MAG: GntR family transcriptional regulator [Dehalococcoidia bacterium]|nr:GntR family transcriptional regulator [Dehalococcoidia bacterium]
MLITLDERDARPIYQQIVSQVKEQIQRGDLQPGDELPPVRELAGALGINLHTVRGAYGRLRDQGIIDLRLGRRARISQARRAPASVVEAETALGGHLRELVSEAFLLGLSANELHSMLDSHLGNVNVGASTPDSNMKEKR